MGARVDETMRRVEESGLVVRLWLAGREDAVADAVARQVRQQLTGPLRAYPSRHVADALAAMMPAGLLNAIEVVDRRTGDGALIYPEWP